MCGISIYSCKNDEKYYPNRNYVLFWIQNKFWGSYVTTSDILMKINFNWEPINKSTVSKIIHKLNEIENIRDKSKSSNLQLLILLKIEGIPNFFIRSLSRNKEICRSVHKILKKENYIYIKPNLYSNLMKMTSIEVRNIVKKRKYIIKIMVLSLVIFSDKAVFV